MKARLSIRAKLLIAIVILVCLFPIASPLWIRLIYYEGVAHSPEEIKAKKNMLIFLAEVLPTEATDIHYYMHFYSFSYEASFHVTEAEFLAWAQQIESSALPESDPEGNPIQPQIIEEYSQDSGYLPSFYESSDERKGRIPLSPGYFLDSTRTPNAKSMRIAYSVDRQRAYLTMKR